MEGEEAYLGDEMGYIRGFSRVIYWGYAVYKKMKNGDGKIAKDVVILVAVFRMKKQAKAFRMMQKDKNMFIVSSFRGVAEEFQKINK
jgi:hypothetical protein